MQSAPEGPLTYAELVPLIERCTGVRVTADQLAAPDAEFVTLGVDSLGLLGVVAELERRYATPLGTDAEQAPTAHDLIAAVNRELGEEI